MNLIPSNFAFAPLTDIKDTSKGTGFFPCSSLMQLKFVHVIKHVTKLLIFKRKKEPEFYL